MSKKDKGGKRRNRDAARQGNGQRDAAGHLFGAASGATHPVPPKASKKELLKALKKELKQKGFKKKDLKRAKMRVKPSRTAAKAGATVTGPKIGNGRFVLFPPVATPDSTPDEIRAVQEIRAALEEMLAAPSLGAAAAIEVPAPSPSDGAEAPPVATADGPEAAVSNEPAPPFALAIETTLLIEGPHLSTLRLAAPSSFDVQGATTAAPEHAFADSPPDMTDEAAQAPHEDAPIKEEPKQEQFEQEKARQGTAEEYPKPNFDLLSQNLARLVTDGAKVLGAFLEPYEQGRARTDFIQQVVDAVQSFGRVAEYWLSDPSRTLTAQKTLSTQFLDLWAHTLRRLSCEAEEPLVPFDPTDKRYAAPQWRDSPFFDFLRQGHALASQWAGEMIAQAEGTEPEARSKAQFYLRQLSSALAPSNFVVTNPEVLHETLASNAENLVRGVEYLAEDLAAGKGTLRIRQSDASQFELGVNMAATRGKVVFRSDLVELIQYAPSTETVYRRPLLIVPPWINKFYILDLNPQKSFVRFAVAQGFTVFLVSWVNPDARYKDFGFEAYLHQGVMMPLDVIENITGERQIAALGYCVGGTLLAIALALMAKRSDNRIASATFLTTQTDFAEAGDLKIFTSEPQIAAIEEMMAEAGYLDGTKMATVFNMLRPNDLIWSFVVNNYMRGKPPLPFDLLTWNSDSTRMTPANHSFYLRNCYLDNKLAKGEMEIDGEKLDLAGVHVPVYHLATREDHIAPASSVYAGAKLFSGEVRYVLAGSGHIAGVVNPADSDKYQYWTGAKPAGTYENWLAAASEHKGSWWPDWAAWLAAQAPDKVAARPPGSEHYPPLGDAPGDYVRMKS